MQRLREVIQKRKHAEETRKEFSKKQKEAEEIAEKRKPLEEELNRKLAFLTRKEVDAAIKRDTAALNVNNRDLQRAYEVSNEALRLAKMDYEATLFQLQTVSTVAEEVQQREPQFEVVGPSGKRMRTEEEAMMNSNSRTQIVSSFPTQKGVRQEGATNIFSGSGQSSRNSKGMGNPNRTGTVLVLQPHKNSLVSYEQQQPKNNNSSQ